MRACDFFALGTFAVEKIYCGFVSAKECRDDSGMKLLHLRRLVFRQLVERDPRQNSRSPTLPLDSPEAQTLELEASRPSLYYFSFPGWQLSPLL